MKIKNLILILILVSSNVFAVTDYYVDGQNGNDSNDGLTLSTAWETIYKANTTLVAGDTVYVLAGEYDNGNDPGTPIIDPDNNGTSGNYITYTNYGDDIVYLGCIPTENTWAIHLRDNSYIMVDGFQTKKCSRFISLEATDGATCEHNIIQNCIFDGDYVAGSPWQGVRIGSVDYDNLGTIQYNRILNCDFVNCDCMPNDVIYFIYGDVRYNLIQGCSFDGGSHDAIEFQTAGKGAIEYNIIRQCTIRNENHVGINVYWNSDRNLIEDCIIYDCGDDYANNACGTAEDRARPRWNHASIGLGSKYTIVRKNRFYNNGAFHIISGRSYSEATDNRIYHNSFYKEQRAVYAESSGLDCDGNIFKNNIVLSSVDNSIYHNVDVTNRNNYFAYNCFYDNDNEVYWEPGGDGKTISLMEANYPSLWFNNITSDPQFVNAQAGDFNLQSSSPCVDAAAWLTEITSSGGSGSSFEVSDASYFCDGWGVIPGDVIQLEGQTQTAQVTNVDYASNTITVDTPLSWYAGQGVSLAYLGFSPDIGAHEYTSGSNPLNANINASPTSGTAPLSVNFTGSASGGTSPYSYSWDFDDGGSSTAQNPSHAFSTAGTYTVTLTVTDNESNQDSDTVVISVANPTNPLTASVSASPTSGTAPLSVNFTGSASGGTSPYSYSWNFGDGGSSTAQNPSHAYSNAGTFIAILTVTDSSSSQTTDSLTINVSSSAGTQQLSLSTITGGPAPGFGGTTDPIPGSHNYASGSIVALSAIPNTDFRFSEWEGDVNALNAYNPQFSLNMDTDKDLSAFFCTRCGDVNGDLTVTASDAQGAFDIFLSRNSSPTKCETENADVSCDSKVTPGDAQAIFNKFIMKGELPADCSGKTRALQAQSLSIQAAQLIEVHLIVEDAEVNDNGYVYVPIIIDNPSNIDAFGFDLQFPTEVMEFMTFDVTGLLDEYNQVDAYYTEEGLLRVGGYSGTPLLSDSPEVLITLVFRVKDEAAGPFSLVITNTYDDIKNATVKDGTVINEVQHDRDPINRSERERILKRFERLPTLLFIRF